MPVTLHLQLTGSLLAWPAVGGRRWDRAHFCSFATTVDAKEPADIVTLDLESVDMDLASRINSIYAGSEIIAVCSEHREADCIVVIQIDINYLLGQDLVARVRAAELRRFNAEGR